MNRNVYPFPTFLTNIPRESSFTFTDKSTVAISALSSISTRTVSTIVFTFNKKISYNCKIRLSGCGLNINPIVKTTKCYAYSINQDRFKRHNVICKT